MASHPVTIIDLARELGISKSTVSRALTDHPNVHPETRKRVLEIAQLYDYQPNMLAKGLIQRKTYHLGVVIPDIEKPFFASIVSGIQKVAFQAGYRIIITQSNESAEEEVANIEALVLSRVDGLLVCHTRETSNFEQIYQIHKKGLPIIQFARICPGLPVTKVVENDVEGSYLVVRHLLESGSRRIALLSGPQDLMVCQLRKEGYKKAIGEAGISMDRNLVFHTNFLEKDIASALDQWMTLSSPPDAIFAIYDRGAIELIRQLKLRGKKIPEDIQIAGFGNDPVADIIDPTLTTYGQNPFKIGKIACQQMLHCLAGNYDNIENIIVPGNFLKRGSTL